MNSIQNLTTKNLHAIAIMCLSAINVWLCIQNVRWLMYSYPVSKWIPTVNQYNAIDLVLEIPGVLVGIVAAYILILRLAMNVWRIRKSEFRHPLMTRVLTINSALLVIVTLVAIPQWLVWYRYLPVDVIVVASLGVASAIASLVLENRVARSGEVASKHYQSISFLKSLGGVWGRSNRP